MKAAVRSTLFVVMTLAFASATTLTLAQPPRGKTTKPAPKPKKPKAVDAGAPSTEVDAAVEPMTGKGESAPAEKKEPKSQARGTGEPAEVVENKTLDGGAKVFRFGEVEIEGRLRSPQLVYFLRRVRAEFAAGDLGHRSFMRELSDTRRDPSF